MSKLNAVSIGTLTGKPPIKMPTPDARWILPDTFIGVEIETEGTLLRNSKALKRAGWDWHHDGSLRAGGQEFTFEEPLMGDEISRAIDTFFSEDTHVIYETNPRAGVHVHINWLDEKSDIRGLRNLVAIMYCIEPGVFDWVDGTRKWCGYCCQLTELSDQSMRTIMTTESETVMANILKDNGELSQNRYFGVNLAAIGKYGTVEFRYFPSTKEKKDVENWIQFVMQVKRAADKFEGESNQLIDILSTQEGITGFLLTHFSEFDIGRTILDNLDLRAAVDRMTDFGYLVKLTPARRPGGFERPRSSSALRFIGKKYPSMLPRLQAAPLFIKPGMLSENMDAFETYLSTRRDNPQQNNDPFGQSNDYLDYATQVTAAREHLNRIRDQVFIQRTGRPEPTRPARAPAVPQWSPDPYWDIPLDNQSVPQTIPPELLAGTSIEGDNP